MREMVWIQLGCQEAWPQGLQSFGWTWSWPTAGLLRSRDGTSQWWCTARERGTDGHECEGYCPRETNTAPPTKEVRREQNSHPSRQTQTGPVQMCTLILEHKLSSPAHIEQYNTTRSLMWPHFIILGMRTQAATFPVGWSRRWHH